MKFMFPLLVVNVFNEYMSRTLIELHFGQIEFDLPKDCTHIRLQCVLMNLSSDFFFYQKRLEINVFMVEGLDMVCVRINLSFIIDGFEIIKFY